MDNTRWTKIAQIIATAFIRNELNDDVVRTMYGKLFNLTEDDEIGKAVDAVQKDLVVIPRKEYNSLLNADEELSKLYAGGVDNWEHYDDALRT